MTVQSRVGVIVSHAELHRVRGHRCVKNGVFYDIEARSGEVFDLRHQHPVIPLEVGCFFEPLQWNWIRRLHYKRRITKPIKTKKCLCRLCGRGMKLYIVPLYPIRLLNTRGVYDIEVNRMGL